MGLTNATISASDKEAEGRRTDHASGLLAREHGVSKGRLMRSLTQKEKWALHPVCPPGSLGLYALTAGLAATLIALGVPAQEVALLLGAAALSAIAVTRPAMAVAFVRAVGTVLVRIAAAVGPRVAAPVVTS